MDTEDRAKWQSTLDALAPQIAAGLEPAGQWHVGPEQAAFSRYNAQAVLTGPDGAELDLSIDHGQQRTMRLTVRAEFNGLWARLAWADEDITREITVSPDKAPARIAGDITRRLLPGYLAAMGRARVRKAAHDAEGAAVLATSGMLVAQYAAHGARASEYHNGSFPGDMRTGAPCVVSFRRSLPTVTIRHTGEEIEFPQHFTCPINQAIRILDILAEDLTLVTPEEEES